jgi:hypothetical protein
MIHERELLEVETKTYLKAYATAVGEVVETHVVVDSGLDAHEVVQIEAIASLQSQGDVVVLFLGSVMNNIGFTGRRVYVGFIGFDSRLSFEAIEQTTTQINTSALEIVARAGTNLQTIDVGTLQGLMVETDTAVGHPAFLNKVTASSLKTETEVRVLAITQIKARQ